jgi:hypothetical protein
MEIDLRETGQPLLRFLLRIQGFALAASGGLGV